MAKNVKTDAEQRWPNYPTGGNAELGPWFGAEYHCLGVPQPGCSAAMRPMKRFMALAALMALMTAFVGCSRAVTGGYTDSPDGKYRCWMRQFGPLSYAIIDRWTLRIRVVEVIEKRTNWVEKPLFTKKYRFKHPYVRINPSWDKEDNLRMVLYEYGRGVPEETALKAGSASNLIETVSLVMDKKTGVYHEQQ